VKHLLALIVLIHSWYPQSCCGGKDCHPVACERIQVVDGGFLYQGLDGQVFFPRQVMKISQDDDCHVCIVKDVSPSGICLFLAPRA